jgi:hypothetical protein
LHILCVRKKRTLLLCAVCALLAILALLAFKPQPHEPSYDGHPLSFWVAALARATPIGLDTPTPREQLRKATNAIDHIGVAALPFLMKWIQYEPAQWRLKLFYKLNAAPSPRARLLSRWVINQKTFHLATGACRAFGPLGTRAMPAFEDLCRLLNDTNRPYTSSGAALALGNFGTNALPQLWATAKNANNIASFYARAAITEIQTREKVAASATNAFPQ